VFGELKNPETSEIAKDRTEWRGGEAMEIGRAVPPVRPAVEPRSGDHDEAQKSENGAASGAVAGPADLAKHGVGGCRHAAVSTTISELNSEQGATPDRRGGIVGAGG
jgi:hypothetical protein